MYTKALVRLFSRAIKFPVSALVAASVFAAPSVLAASGDLDPSFADHGRQSAIPGTSGNARSVELIDAGGIFVGGSGHKFRLFADTCSVTATSFASQLSEDGTSDPSFVSAHISDIEALALARQADGRIVGVGRRVLGSGGYGRCYLMVRSLSVFRLNADGSFDASFGTNGIFDWDAGELSSQHQGRSLLLEPTGGVIVAGIGGMELDNVGGNRLLVLRLLADGSLDPSFADGGVFVAPAIVGFSDDVSISRATTGGYRVVSSGTEGCVVAGITAGGMPDVTFGDQGVATVAASGQGPVVCDSLESRADGRLVVAGSLRGRGFVLQLLANGAVDSSFTADASIAASLKAVTAITIAGDGGVFVAGVGSKGMSILRLNATGALDTSFGHRGRTWIDLPSSSESKPRVLDLALRADGSLIVAGGTSPLIPFPTRTPDDGASPFVVRLLGDAGGASAGVVSFLPAGVNSKESEGQAIVRVRRSGGKDGDVSVSYHTVADGAATADQDFTPTDGTLHWADGDSSEQKIVVDIAHDEGSPEGTETFHIALDDVQGGAGLGMQLATVGIQPDGAPGGQIQMYDMYGDGPGNAIANETDPAQVWLIRDYYSVGRVCVTVTTRSGGAVSGEDFTQTNTTQCWDDHDMEQKVVLIPTLQDGLAEGEETFTVELSNPTGGAILGAQRVATVTIIANPAPEPTAPPPDDPGQGGSGGGGGGGGGGPAGVAELLALIGLLLARSRTAARIRPVHTLIEGDFMNKSNITNAEPKAGRLAQHSMAFAAALLCLAFAAPALSQTYTAIDVPGYPYTHAFGMNDFGSIVGDCDFADGYVSAYVLRRGNFTIFDAPGAVATSAWDINNLGVIVGDYYGEDYLFHGFLYVDGKLTTIDFPGAVHTSAQGIDDFGRIVGIFIDDTDTWRGFILVGDKFRVIEAPNAQFTTAVGITGPDIVGDMEINGVSSGYVLRKGRFMPIAYPGANFTTANRINYSGEIVGTWAEDPDAQVGHAYLLTQRGFTSFDFPHATLTTGRDVNDQGDVVGSFRDEAGYVHGFLRVPRKAGRR